MFALACMLVGKGAGWTAFASRCVCVCVTGSGVSPVCLSSAMRANKAFIKSDTVEAEVAVEDVPHDIVATRAIAAEITTRGAKLYDLLKEEQTLRDARNKVLRVCARGWAASLFWLALSEELLVVKRASVR